MYLFNQQLETELIQHCRYKHSSRARGPLFKSQLPCLLAAWLLSASVSPSRRIRNIILTYFTGLRGLNELIWVGHLEHCYPLRMLKVNICCYYYYYMPGIVLYNGEYSNEENGEGSCPYRTYNLVRERHFIKQATPDPAISKANAAFMNFPISWHILFLCQFPEALGPVRAESLSIVIKSVLINSKPWSLSSFWFSFQPLFSWGSVRLHLTPSVYHIC